VVCRNELWQADQIVAGEAETSPYNMDRHSGCAAAVAEETTFFREVYLFRNQKPGHF
jgi:hypothetical protein